MNRKTEIRIKKRIFVKIWLFLLRNSCTVLDMKKSKSLLRVSPERKRSNGRTWAQFTRLSHTHTCCIIVCPVSFLEEQRACVCVCVCANQNQTRLRPHGVTGSRLKAHPEMWTLCHEEGEVTTLREIENIVYIGCFFPFFSLYYRLNTFVCVHQTCSCHSEAWHKHARGSAGPTEPAGPGVRSPGSACPSKPYFQCGGAGFKPRSWTQCPGDFNSTPRGSSS